jgi:hypothetical protein
VWTLPAILGFNLSRKVAILMMIAQYAVVFVQIWQGYYRWWTLGIVSSAAPALLRTIKVCTFGVFFCRTESDSSNQIFNADRPKERPQGNISLTSTIIIYLPSMMYHQKSQQKSGPCITSRMLSVTTKCSVPCTYLVCASIPCTFASCKYNARQSLGK